MEFSRINFDRERTKITEEELTARLRRVKPLVLRNDRLYRFKIPDLRRTAFTWEPTFLKRYRADIMPLQVTQTHHSCAYYGFFKPSIAEVMAQLPDDPLINGVFLDLETIQVCADGEGHLVDAHWFHRRTPQDPKHDQIF